MIVFLWRMAKSPLEISVEKDFLSAASQRYYDICGAIAHEGKLALVSRTLTNRKTYEQVRVNKSSMARYICVLITPVVVYSKKNIKRTRCYKVISETINAR